MSKKKIGLSTKTPPKGNARPLGTPKPPKPNGRGPSESSMNRQSAQMEKNFVEAQNFVDTAPSPPVVSQPVSALTPNPNKGASFMDLTLVRNDNKRRSTSIVYTADGLRGSVRVSKSAFSNGSAPANIVVSSDVFASPKVPQAKMTPEERKAFRAAQPKPTLAEKIQRRETLLARDKAKLAEQASL